MVERGKSTKNKQLNTINNYSYRYTWQGLEGEGETMAQPIRATPTLTGDEAIHFLEKMKANENARPTKADKKLLDIIDANFKAVHV